tara:strand:- start:45 stop:1808 length:1764 start_codon:yes stop_codon:yes gene_type:complete
MANLATTATESLQCIACAIRQKEGGSISSADLLDFLENEKERGNNLQNREVLNHVRIPSNVIPFLVRWLNEGGVYEFPSPGYFDKLDDDESNLILAAKKGSNLEMWVNSCVWIANKLANSKYLSNSKKYRFYHADQPVGNSRTNFKAKATAMIKDAKANAVDPNFRNAINLLARGTGDKWNPADIFAIDMSKENAIGLRLSSNEMPDASAEIFKMASDAKGNAKKDMVFYAEMGQLNAYNRYVDKLFEDHESIPISLKKAGNASPSLKLLKHKDLKGIEDGLNLEVEITKVDYKPTADKAIVEFSIGGKSGAMLDFRGFEKTANIENVQAQIQAAGSTANHGKITLPLYSFIVEQSGGMAAIRAQQRVKKKLFGNAIPNASDTVFTPASIFIEYANNKAPKARHRANTSDRFRFNQRTLLEDTPAWAQYIQWLSKGSIPSETSVGNLGVVRNVRQKLGDPTGSAESQMPTKKIGGQKKVVFASAKSELMKEWSRNPRTGKLIRVIPRSRYEGKPQDFVWAAKYIKNKVQSAEAVFVVDLARKAPKKAIKEAILKSAYSYAASKGLRIFSNSEVREFMSASTYIKVGG